MEVNKDEAFRCIEIAVQSISEGKPDKAERFLLKAERLYSTPKAKELLEQLKNKENAAPPSSPEMRRRTNTAKDKQPTSKDSTPTMSSTLEYTVEQLEQVQRIKKCKDYYEILRVKKDAPDTEIKKSYKKLALILHPDKNKAPGSAEAFKAIGNAVAILTDVEKRKQYDLYGGEENQQRVHRQQHTYEGYTRGFEADVSAEELFNMFFGTRFNTYQPNVFTRRTHRTWRRESDSDAPQHNQGHNETAVIIQLLPILLLIVISMLSGFFISDPVYSLQQNSKYPIPRQSMNLKVPYFVKENFRSEYQGSISRLETNVEEEYLTNLKHVCLREKNHRETMLYRGRSFGDEVLLEKARNMRTPSCDEYYRLIRN